MKYILLVTFALLTSISIISCNNGTPTGLIDKSSIWLVITASPSVSVESGSTPYTVYCQLQDESATDGMGDFSGVTIIINGYTFPDTSDSNYWASSGDISLTESDFLTVYIEHPSFGNIEATATVPPSLPSVSSFNIDPAFPGTGIANTEYAYSLSWTGIGVDGYSPDYTAYSDADGLNFIQGRGYYTGNNYYTLSVSDSSPFPYLDISVSTVDETIIPDFRSTSWLRVMGTYIPEITNTN